MSQVIWQLACHFCNAIYEVWFHVWRFGAVIEHCKVPKYDDEHCSFV